MTLQRVLVGVDGRAPSLEAVRTAVDLVAADGTILLARVVPTSAVRRAADWVRQGAQARATRAYRELEAKRGLSKLAAEIRLETPARVEVTVSRGRVADELLRLSAERSCDLVVIGATRPRPRLGAVADDLIRGNPKPTLVIREGVPLSRVRDALVLAPAPLSAWDLDEAGAALSGVESRYDFMALGRGPRPSLGWELESVPRRTVLIVQQHTAVRELGTSWLLSRTSCPVLFIPAPRALAPELHWRPRRSRLPWTGTTATTRPTSPGPRDSVRRWAPRATGRPVLHTTNVEAEPLRGPRRWFCSLS